MVKFIVSDLYYIIEYFFFGKCLLLFNYKLFVNLIYKLFNGRVVIGLLVYNEAFFFLFVEGIINFNVIKF